MEIKMGPSFANLFVGYIGNKPVTNMLVGFLICSINFLTTLMEQRPVHVTRKSRSLNLSTKFTWNISETCLSFLDASVDPSKLPLDISHFHRPSSDLLSPQ